MRNYHESRVKCIPHLFLIVVGIRHLCLKSHFPVKPSFQMLFRRGEYNLARDPATFSFDSSFITPPLCCAPGAYYENGVGVEPVTMYGVQRLYDPTFPGLPYVAPPYYSSPQLNGTLVKTGWPRNILMQPGYDSRYAEERTAERFINFIDSNSDDEVD